jgi:hypothetical protein
MRKILFAAATATGLIALGVTAASALPADRGISGVSVSHEQVHLVCDEFGRCWRTGPRYRYGYRYAPRYRYGYSHGPRYHHRRHYYHHGHHGHHGPGVSFRFGF